MRRLAMLGVLFACLALGAAPAAANREVLSEALLEIEPAAKPPRPPAGQIDGACGLVASVSSIYVSDYYNRVIDVFSGAGEYRSQIALPGGPITGLGSNSLDGVCGLAMAPSGALYGNEWHQGVWRLRPSIGLFLDAGEATGVAVDDAGRLYVDQRTRVDVYEPSGEPVESSGQPLTIGEGSLGDAYGVAVAADGSRVYVPDAASGTVKVFEPGADPVSAVAAISPPGGFVSLIDAAPVLDPKTGHLLVVGNAQPGYERPAAAIQEFGPPPSYAYLGALACAPGFGGPSGVAFDVSGNLYVTDGDGERSNVFKYGPYTSAPVAPSGCASGGGAGTGGVLAGVSSLPAPASSAARPRSKNPASAAAPRRAAPRSPPPAGAARWCGCSGARFGLRSTATWPRPGCRGEARPRSTSRSAALFRPLTPPGRRNCASSASPSTAPAVSTRRACHAAGAPISTPPPPPRRWRHAVAPASAKATSPRCCACLSNLHSPRRPG